MLNYLHVYYTWSSLFTVENLRWTYSNIIGITQEENRKWNGKYSYSFVTYSFDKCSSEKSAILTRKYLVTIYTLVLQPDIGKTFFGIRGQEILAKILSRSYIYIYNFFFHCRISAFKLGACILMRIPLFIAHIYTIKHCCVRLA